MSFISSSVNSLKPSPTIAVTQKAMELREQGKKIIGLSVGEPDFNTPEHIQEAAIKAMRDGHTRYTAVAGITELKQAIIEKFARDNNISAKPENIIVGCGAKHIIFNAFMATLNAGDEVIIPAPYWVSYPDMVSLFAGKPVIIAAKQEANFKITPEQLKQAITPKTKWLVLNSPSNPTGSVYTEAELRQILEIVADHPNLYVMSDDIYEYLIYDNHPFATLASLADDDNEVAGRILTVNGVSKSYAMTGWRIGYARGSATLIKAMTKIQSQSTTNPCSISQYASLAALTGSHEFLATFKSAFVARRNLVVDKMRDIDGIECLKPEGAFYVYPSVANFIGRKTPSGNIINNDADFVSYLLEDKGIAAVHGEAFGLSPHFRISYATSNELLEEACAAIKDACGKLS
jgi:aspartate aminotransferase